VQFAETRPPDSSLLVGCPGCPKCIQHHGYIFHLSAGRPTKAHEYLFLLAKCERYYYDADAIREPHVTADRPGERRSYPSGSASSYTLANGHHPQRGAFAGLPLHDKGRNKRSVWTIPTMPYSGAHFATMPEALVEPCILAGCPLGGLVLDPFLGSGTVGAVAERLGRRWVGTDLSYQPLAKARTAQRGIPFEMDAITLGG
jgi:hypothetical protein